MYERKVLIDGEKATLTLKYDDLADRWSATLVGPNLSVRDINGINRKPTQVPARAAYRIELTPRDSTQSAGTALVRTRPTGAVSLAGVLPNGAVFSSSALLGPNGAASVYDWISDTAGSLAGKVHVSQGEAQAPTGALRWENAQGESVTPEILDLVETP